MITILRKQIVSNWSNPDLAARTHRRPLTRQNRILDELEKEHPGISSVRKDPDGTIVLSVEESAQKRAPE